MQGSAQIRAARGFLDWSQGKLAEAAGISLPTIKRMESKGLEACSYGNVKAVQQALEGAGIVFTSEGGVTPSNQNAQASNNP